MSINISKIKQAQGLEASEAGSYPVSFCIIATEEDFKERGMGMLQSLPVSAEVNVLINKEGTADTLSEIETVSQHPLLRKRVWTYAPDTFSFAEARNHAHDMATHDWVFWIDCDERMNPMQHRDIYNLAEELPGGYGGIMAQQVSLRTVSEHFGERTDGRGEYEAIGQCRMYRKSTGVRWYGHCHEQIADPLEQLGYKLLATDITITHGGYVIGRDQLTAKLERNARLLLKQTSTMDKNHPMYFAYCDMLVRDMGGWIQLMKGQKK